jgi:hypothetical protein
MRLSKRSKKVDCCSAANGYETPVIPWVDDAMVFGCVCGVTGRTYSEVHAMTTAFGMIFVQIDTR